MRARPTIFLSGVSSEFRSFRDAVENEIEMKGCFAENQPGFPPDYRTVEEMLRRKLEEADAVIHIVGFRFGAEPNQRPPEAPRRSYTQMEFDLARALGKPVYVFLAQDASVRQAPAPDEQPEDAQATALQLLHCDAVQETNYLRYVFRTKPSCASWSPRSRQSPPLGSTPTSPASSRMSRRNSSVAKPSSRF